MSKKNLFIFFITALVFFCLGLATLRFIFYRNQICFSQKHLNQNFPAGWEAAYNQLGQADFLEKVGADTLTTSINGTIEKVEDTRIVAEVHLLIPPNDPDLNSRIIIIDNQTIIKQLAEKDAAQYEKEIEEFNSRFGNSPGQSEVSESYPNRYEEREVGKNVLRPGQSIMIKTSDDIEGKKQFEAEEITIYPQ